MNKLDMLKIQMETMETIRNMLAFEFIRKFLEKDPVIDDSGRLCYIENGETKRFSKLEQKRIKDYVKTELKKRM